MYPCEILHVKKADKTDYYEVMSVFTEKRSLHLSWLVVELIPLKHITPMQGGDLVISCKPPSQKLTFDLKLDHESGVATFAKKRDVLLPENLQSSGLGAYVFSKLIQWGQHIAPEYPVTKLKLSRVDAETEESKTKRNEFYRSLKFELDFTHDPEEQSGSCTAKNLRSLAARGVNDKKVIKVVAMHERYIDMAARQDELEKELASLKSDIIALQKQRKNLKEGNACRSSWCLGSAALSALLIVLWVWKFDALNILRGWFS